MCDYLDDGEFNSGAGEYLSAAATGALSAVISPAKCAENVAKRMVKSGLKEAAIGAVGDGIKQLADGEFDPKEMAINAGKNFVSGALNGKFNASCFAAGTMIETADGDRPIEEIQIGDLVLSANPETGEIAYKPVVNTYVHVTDTVLYLTIDEEIIETTEDHPFWVEGQGWTSAKLLQPGDVVRLKDGSTQCVDDIEIVELPEGEYVAVYNFEVADFHTYFVSDYDVLVHNNCKSRQYKNGYQSSKRASNLYAPDRSNKKTKQVFDNSRIINSSNLKQERELFLGKDAVKVDKGKWRSLDGTRQFRIKPQDYLGKHGGGSHAHFEFLSPNKSGTKYNVTKNIHVKVRRQR